MKSRKQYEAARKQKAALMKHGTKKQVRAYRGAIWNAYSPSTQQLMKSHGKFGMCISTWTKYHNIGYKAATKAGFRIRTAGKK